MFIAVLRSKEKVKTSVYRFRSKNGSYVHLRSEMLSFINPWTKEIEYIVSTNTLVRYVYSLFSFKHFVAISFLGRIVFKIPFITLQAISGLYLLVEKGMKIPFVVLPN